jgi:hypothetical protein
VRGIFIIQSFREKFFYSSLIFSKNSQTYLRNFLSKTPSEQPQTAAQFLCQKSVLLYGCHSINYCMDCLEICAQNSRNSCPEKQNCTALVFCVNGCTDYTEISSEKHDQQSLQFLCKENQYGSLGMCANLLRNFVVVPLDFCAYKKMVRPLEICMVQPPNSTVLCLDLHASLLP